MKESEAVAIRDSSMSDEQQSRLVTWVSPRVYVDAVKSGRFKTGLDLLRAIQDGTLPAPPIAELLDYGPAHFEDGRAVFECVPQEFHYNPLGVVHGSLAAALCDTAMACAIHTKLPINVGYTTLELKVNYIRAITVETGRMRCTGEVIHVGKRTAVAESRLVDPKERLLAHATTTCLVLS